MPFPSTGACGVGLLRARAAVGVRLHSSTSSLRAPVAAGARCADPITSALEWRGLVAAVTRPEMQAHLSLRPTGVYAGFDPTARSLHVGNLLTIVALIHFAAAGHAPVALVGGATGSIGDPSGRSSERSALDTDTIVANTAAIRRQLTSLFANAQKTMARFHDTDHEPQQEDQHDAKYRLARDAWIKADPNVAVTVLNNYDWFHNISFLDFLASVGRVSRVSTMLARESVKSRLDAPDGISFTEFTYQLLQAYDFRHLHLHHGVTVQIGGSDQWGNILSGIDLIRRMPPPSSATPSTPASTPASTPTNPSAPPSTEDHVYGLTIPLVTTASGEKFGKSAGNAVWLEPNLCPPFDLYQFFRRTPDSEASRYLRYFTFLPRTRIEALTRLHEEDPAEHAPQRALAYEVTHLVHGGATADACRLKSELLFDPHRLARAGGLPGSAEILRAFAGDERAVRVPRAEVLGRGVVEVVVRCGVCRGFNAARKLITAGGLYVGGVKVENKDAVVREEDVMDGRLLLLRSGKNNYTIAILE
ncbi:hypothetical protein BC830DRAFT_1241722 [Chytriomyces sp. MP71]|nr:hypothetical protein BC830DRAFT_1241722 [Chytriomyces sp. MP71]